MHVRTLVPAHPTHPALLRRHMRVATIRLRPHQVTHQVVKPMIVLLVPTRLPAIIPSLIVLRLRYLTLILSERLPCTHQVLLTNTS